LARKLLEYSVTPAEKSPSLERETAFLEASHLKMLFSRIDVPEPNTLGDVRVVVQIPGYIDHDPMREAVLEIPCRYVVFPRGRYRASAYGVLHVLVVFSVPVFIDVYMLQKQANYVVELMFHYLDVTASFVTEYSNHTAIGIHQSAFRAWTQCPHNEDKNPHPSMGGALMECGGATRGESDRPLVRQCTTTYDGRGSI
jgi:hypothetical protein